MGCGSILLLKVFHPAGGWVEEHDKMRCRLDDGRRSGGESWSCVSFIIIVTWLLVSWLEL